MRCRNGFRRKLHRAIVDLRNLDRFDSVPILGVHLWFDRPILRESHAALMRGPLQWVFRKDAEGKAAAWRDQCGHGLGGSVRRIDMLSHCLRSRCERRLWKRARRSLVGVCRHREAGNFFADAGDRSDSPDASGAADRGNSESLSCAGITRKRDGPRRWKGPCGVGIWPRMRSSEAFAESVAKIISGRRSSHPMARAFPGISTMIDGFEFRLRFRRSNDQPTTDSSIRDGAGDVAQFCPGDKPAVDASTSRDER